MKPIFLFLFSLLIVESVCSQWNPNTSVNLEVAGINAGPTATATTPDGKTFIAFYSQVTGSFDMRVQLLDKDGNKLFGPNGMVANNYSTGSATYVFNACLGPENSFLIACQDQRNTSNGTVLIRVNQDGSLPWGIGGVYLGTGLAPYPAVLSEGDIIVAWNDNSSKISYQKVSANGIPLWASPKQVQLNTGTSTVYKSTAAVPVPNSTGGFTMIMQRFSNGVSGTLYAQRYNANGDSLWTGYLQLSNQTTSTTRTYSVTMEADTIYYGYYSSVGSRFNSFVQRINPNGTLPWGINGAPFSTYNGTQPYNQTTNVAHAPGSPYIWSVCSYSNSGQSQYGIYIQKFDAITGARIFNIDGKEIYPIGASMDQQIGNLALINDSPLFMSYDANYKIYATRLDTAGNFVWTGNRLELSSTVATLGNAKGRFNFTPAINGQAVAVWNENRNTETRTYAQNITAAGPTGPLPIKLGDFTAVKRGEQVALSWKTLSEQNSKGFYVQRSTNGHDFTNLQFIDSKAANGNSSVALSYDLTDAQPEKGNNYYRLQQVDKDGKTTLSLVLLVKFNATGVYVQSLYPNPAEQYLNVAFSAPLVSKATVSIVDVNGRNLLQQKVSLQNGTTSLQINVAHLPAGNYWLKLSTGNEIVTEKWMKK